MTLASRRASRLPIAKVTKTVGVVVHGAGSTTTGSAKILAGKPASRPIGTLKKTGLHFCRSRGYEKTS